MKRAALVAAVVFAFASRAFAQGIEADGWTLKNPTITGSGITQTEAAAPSTPAAGKVVFYAKSGTPGEFCSKDDAGVETCMSAGSGGGSTVLDQSVGETDFRYDSTLNGYFYDVDGDGSHDTDGSEDLLDLSTVASGVANGVDVRVTAAGAGGLASGSIAITLIAE